MKSMILWGLTLYHSERTRCFGGIYRIHLQSKIYVKEGISVSSVCRLFLLDFLLCLLFDPENVGDIFPPKHPKLTVLQHTRTYSSKNMYFILQPQSITMHLEMTRIVDKTSCLAYPIIYFCY
jgi:hypothetical protein